MISADLSRKCPLPAKTAFIWDLDGTLLDSYAVMVPALYESCREFNIEISEREIFEEVIRHTVGDFLIKTEKRTGIPSADIKRIYSEIVDGQKLNIRLIKNAAEILSWLNEQEIPSFVFTHRGNSTELILKNTGIYDRFKEIVTGKDGFGRKPDPSALLYLVRKHDLDKDHTYYVGDRTLDIECAENAGIRSILYLPENSPASATGKETFVVKDLMDIRTIIENL